MSCQPFKWINQTERFVLTKSLNILNYQHSTEIWIEQVDIIFQGNGHERDFMDDDRVYIMDVYNRGIYPHDGFAKRKQGNIYNDYYLWQEQPPPPTPPPPTTKPIMIKQSQI